MKFQLEIDPLGISDDRNYLVNNCGYIPYWLSNEEYAEKSAHDAIKAQSDTIMAPLIGFRQPNTDGIYKTPEGEVKPIAKVIRKDELIYIYMGKIVYISGTYYMIDIFPT